MNDKLPDVKMDAAGLWREETITDRKAGTIRRLTPIKSDGAQDLSRKVIFVGEAALMTQAGSLPISFEIPAPDLAGAVAGYGDAFQKGFSDAMRELQELRRRASSQIVIPKGGASELLGGNLNPAANKLRPF